ncbi:MAG: hypothetical protein KF849_13490 [Rhizobiaceae bacterium]|jgi:pimeloyl-ACP methyl ester carboxylesterase|nr:hypothetical protein [Rhizobiaceae bacterium]
MAELLSPPSLQAATIDLPDGRSLAGLVARPSEFLATLVVLHETSQDLDQGAGLLGAMSDNELRMLAIDRPGHGLSGDARDDADAEAMLRAALDTISDTRQRPLVIVAIGNASPLAWGLTSHPAVIGLALISPYIGGPLPRLSPDLSLIAFVPQNDLRSVEDWGKLRRMAGCRWLGVTMAVDPIAMLDPNGFALSQIAAHLAGFTREITMHHAVAMPIAEAE